MCYLYTWTISDLHLPSEIHQFVVNTEFLKVVSIILYTNQTEWTSKVLDVRILEIGQKIKFFIFLSCGKSVEGSRGENYLRFSPVKLNMPIWEVMCFQLPCVSNLSRRSLNLALMSSIRPAIIFIQSFLKNITYIIIYVYCKEDNCFSILSFQ